MTQTEDDLERIARQERELQWTSFNEDDAWQLGSTLRELAADRRARVAGRQSHGAGITAFGPVGRTAGEEQSKRQRGGARRVENG